MLRRDYFIKQMEEFGKVLAQILGYKKQKEFEKFEEEISAALKKYSDQDLKSLELKSGEEFEKEILMSQKLDFSQKKIIAAVLFEKMIYFSELNAPERASELKAKCLLLYQHIQTNATENEYDLDVHYKLGFLKNN